MMRQLLLSLLLLTKLVEAEPMKLPRSYFQTEEFAKTFIASYGFISAIEPKVDREESDLLAEVSELFGDGRFTDAERLIVEFVKLRRYPVDPEVDPKEVSPAMIFVLGNLYFQSDRVKDAERSYLMAIDRFPAFRRAHKNLALLYATRDQIDKALPHLKKAVELGDSDHKSFGLLGFAYLKKEKPLAAEGAYRQAYLLSPDEKDWKLGLAQTLLLQEKWKEAAAMLGELIDETPDNGDLWKQQANCYLGMDERLKAATNFEVMRLKGLADVNSLYLLGDIYMDQESPLLALGAYLAAVEKASTVDVARSLKTAKILSDYGSPDEASKFLVAVRDKAGDKLSLPQQVEMKLVQVGIAKSQNNSELEGQLLDEVYQLEPTNGEALVLHGQFYDALSKEAETPEEESALRGKARAKFDLALKLEDPKVLYDANLRFGQMLVRGREYKEGLPYLQKAQSLKSNDSLKQYVRQVERAAKRQIEREESEAAEQEALKKELEKAEAAKNAAGAQQ